ncbi:hypothetical protein NA78x_000455 [Anatilimnocola sp. NA78]|uniref:hypothetical protein n=1 Tax=Anatilimnocola sp. NA78 TaxID=3415683 RepID=UPI003CE48307
MSQNPYESPQEENTRKSGGQSPLKKVIMVVGMVILGLFALAIALFTVCVFTIA